MADEKHANDDYNDPGALGPRPIDEPDRDALAASRSSEQGASGVVGGANPIQGQREPGDDDVAYEDMKAEDLEKLAEDRGVEVEGTGANGNVLKSDFVSALEEADTAPE